MEGQAISRFSIYTGIVAIGVLLLGATLLWSQTYIDFSSKPNVNRVLKSNSAANKSEVQAAPSYAAAAAPIFSDDFNAGTLDLNKWRLGTNAGNQTAVGNNALQLRAQDAVYQSGWAVTRNAYPARNTTIAVKVVQPNNDGDLGMSPTYNLSSIYGIYNETNFYRFYTYRNTSSGAYLLYVEWKKNGVLNGFDVTGNLVITGAVYLRLRCDDTKIHFDASLDGVTWTDTYNEAFALSGYTLDTPFYYELAGYKTWANGALVVDDFSITSQSTDTQPPQISAVAAQNITGSSAQITWQTDEAADSQVEYGLTTSYGSSSSLNTSLVTSHTVSLSSLQANTTYHYRVKSKDAAGNLATSGDFAFTTLQGDVTPPVISNVASSNITTSAATITWTTNESSDSQVEYGLTTSYGSSSSLNTSLVTSHTAALSSLQANTMYHYRVKSKDAAGNLATSGDFIFTTLQGDVTPPVISNVASSNITSSAATITWTTNESSDSQVEYGLTTSYGSSSSLNTSLVTSHTVSLSSLQANTTYHYRVKSKDAAGNLATSGDFTFTTSSTPPANSVLLYTPFEVTLSTARSYGNPYLDISVTGVFTSPSGRQLRLNGFWDGGQTWRVRFSPNELGLWSYSTQSADPDLATSGTFEAVPSSTYGFVRTSASQRYQFEYSDGTPFLLMGDTNWDGMSSGVGFETRFKPYIDLRASQRFNAYHSIIVHNRYDYQSNEGGAPFVMFDPETRDYNRLNPGFFQWVDRRVAYANGSGMVSILFFTWSHELQKMSADQYQKLALYIVSRYAAYNVFWVLVGDYQAYFYDPPLYRQVGSAVAAADPFAHPLSIHPRDGYTNREFGNDAWLSYVMHQIRDAGEFLADSVRDTRLYNKPVVNGEYGYHVPASVHPYNGIPKNANYTRTGGWSIFTAGGYFVAGFNHTFYDPDGHYPYDPGFDLPPTYWDLNDPADLEAARQYSVFYNFYHDQTSWWELEPHREWVLDGQTELLAKPGAEYVAYNARGGRMRLQLPAGQYFSLAWFDPIAGALQPARVFESTGETILLMPSDTLDAVAMLRPASVPALTSLGDVIGLQRTQLNIRQVRFTWQTPDPADSRIDLQKPDGTRIQFVDNRETTAHDLVVDGLSPNVNYTVTMASQTADGREWKSAPQNFLTNVQVMDEWIEAENMPTKTVGHAEPPGWNLDANGYLAISRNFPQTGPYRFVIRCRGEYRNAWPTLSFQLDNNELAALSINSAVFKEFALVSDVTAGTHQIKIAFTNAGEERQLIVDWLHVQFNGATDTQSPMISQVAATDLTTSTATINWQTDEPADSQVEYGLTTSYDWSTPLDATLVTSHTVTLSNLQANTTYHYRVKSKDAANNLATSGDFVFTTLSPPPTLTLTSPNGGESWMVGSTQNIVWSSTGTLPNVKLEYSVDNGANWVTIIASTANDGSESWTVPDNASTQCLVRVSDAADGNPADVSDAAFAIVVAPMLTLTSPNGGESWTVGAVQNILWNSTSTLPNVKLEFSVDNGANWVTIIASTANDGSESWTVPDNASTQCLVRVSDAADGNPADVSNAVFAIVEAPTLTLTSPNGSESWMVGAVQNITWSSTGALPNVKLEFSVDNGANWVTIIASTANDGSESWTVPDNASTQCLVRVSDAADGNPADVSDAAFAIVVAPMLTLTSPNGGESWTAGAVQNITWNSTGTLPNVKLEFSVDNGANWVTIIASTANDASENWTIPNNVSSQCLVRVSDAVDGNPADVSDAVFSIVAVPAPTIISFAPTSGPVGTEVTIIGTNFTGATRVAFNEMNATSFTVDSGTQIRAMVPIPPPGGTTSGKISVTNPAGTGTSANDFVVATILTFNPSDDAYVRSDQTSSNYGTATTLRMKQSSPITNSYLKFVVSGVTGAVQSAKLRIKVTTASSSGGSAYTVSNNYRTNSTPWVQSGLNYNNAPTISGTPLSTIGSVSVGQVVEFEVKPAITGNGTFSFGLKNSSSTTVQYSSREGATKPELVIQTGLVTPSLSINDVTVTEGNIPQGGMNAVFTVSLSSVSNQVVTVAYATANGTATAGSDYVAGSGIVTFPAGTITQPITIPVIGDAVTESNETFLINLSNATNATIADAQGQGTIIDDDMVTITLNPTDDAYVRSDQATSNFGTATTLRMKQSSPITNSYLKFVVSGVSGPVLSAKLRLKVTVASSSGGSVYSVSNNNVGTSTPWTQSGLNYNNAPSLSGTPLSIIGSVAVDQMVEFEVTPAITGNGTFSFGLKNSSSTTVRYSSKEGATLPELVIQFGTGTAAKIADRGPETIESNNNEIAAPPPERFSLLPNYPNPFNAETRIVFQLPERSHVKLVLRDLTGRELMILTNEERGAGTHEVSWDGRDASGNLLPSGIYIYSLQAGRFRSLRKLLLVK